MAKKAETFGSNDLWYVRREGRGEDSIIHVHDKVTGTIAFRTTQAGARALINGLSKVTLMAPPKELHPNNRTKGAADG